MDSLSHIVLGAAIGELLLGRKIGKKAMLWGALGANLPDADVFFTSCYHPVDALFVHRGITHSFLFAFLIPPLLGWIFSKFNWKRPATFKEWTTLYYVTILSHPLLDSCTMYGTGILEPFSNYRAQFTSLFIIEPLYTLPLLIGFIALLILKKDSAKRSFWAKFGLWSSTIFLLLAIGNKFYMDKVFSDSLHKQKISHSHIITSPTPFNTILWNAFAKDTMGYWFGFYSHLDRSKEIEFAFVPRNDSLAGDLLQNVMVQKLIRFSNGYYCFTICDNELRFNDLRFAFSGEFDCRADHKNFAFSYSLKKDDSQPFGIEIKRNPWNRTRFYGVSKLIARIRGV